MKSMRRRFKVSLDTCFGTYAGPNPRAYISWYQSKDSHRSDPFPVTNRSLSIPSPDHLRTADTPSHCTLSRDPCLLLLSNIHTKPHDRNLNPGKSPQPTRNPNPPHPSPLPIPKPCRKPHSRTQLPPHSIQESKNLAPKPLHTLQYPCQNPFTLIVHLPALVT